MKSKEPETLMTLINDPSTFILDVRTPMEFAGGSLPRATLIPIDELPQRVDELPQDKNKSIVIFCAHGVRSLHALKLIQNLGYKNVCHIEGGLAHFGRGR